MGRCVPVLRVSAKHEFASVRDCFALTASLALRTNDGVTPPRSSNDRFARKATLFVVLALAANALAFLYQLAMARLLEPRQFAVLLAIISAMAIVAFPANAFQAAVAIGAGRIKAEGASTHLGTFALRAAIGGGTPLVAVAALTFIYQDAVGQFFGFDGTTVILWVCASLILAMWLAAYRGVLQGLEEFTTLGVVTLVEVAIRLLAAFALVLGGFAVVGATAGFPIGLGCALALAVWKLRKRFDRSSRIRVDLWPTLAYESHALPAMLAVFGAQAIDIVIANTRLDDHELEAYSAAALAGRIVFYAGVVVCLLVLPRYRHMFEDRQFEDRLVVGSFGMIALICAGGLVIGITFPGTIHAVLVGSTYAEDIPLMQLYLLGSSGLTCALFLTTIVVAAGWTRVALGLVPIAITQVMVYTLAATNSIEFAQTLTAGAGLMVLVLLGTVATLFRTTVWAEGT